MSYFAWYACISFPMKALAAAALGLHWRNIIIMLYMRICYGYIMVMLWLLLRCCFSQEWGCVIAALPARREWTYLQLLWLLTSPSNFLALTLPTLGLANSVNSKTIGAVNRINNTLSWNSLWASLKRKKKRGDRVKGTIIWLYQLYFKFGMKNSIGLSGIILILIQLHFLLLCGSIFHILAMKCHLLFGSDFIFQYNCYLLNTACCLYVGFPELYIIFQFYLCLGFPGSSAGKESACSTGEPGSIAG